MTFVIVLILFIETFPNSKRFLLPVILDREITRYRMAHYEGGLFE